MIRNMFLKLTAVVATILMLASCSGSSDYLSALPGNSVMVAKVNVGNVLTESEVLTDPQVAGFLKNSINRLDGDNRTLMRELLDDPMASGADLSEPVYVALENVEQMRGLVIVPLADGDKMKHTVGTILANREFRGFVLAQQKGINTIENETGEVLAAFDDSKLVIAFSDGSVDAMEYMTLSQKSQEKSDALQKFINSDDDAAFYLHYGQLVTLVEGMQHKFQGLDLSMLKNAELITKLNFEKGKATLTYKLLGCDEIEGIYNDMCTNPDNDLVAYLPHNTWATAQMGVKNLAVIKQFIKGEIEEIMNKGFEELNNNLAEAGNNAKWSLDLLNSLKGDVIVGVTPVVDNGTREEPQAIFVAECQNKDLFDAIVPLIMIENKHAEKVGDNLYSLGYNAKIDWENYNWDGDYTYVRKGYDYYFGYADGKMFVMPENMYKQCASGENLKGFESSLKENSALYNMIKSNNSVALDITALAAEIGKSNTKDALIIANALKHFESLATRIKNSTETEVIITTTDKDTEILKLIKDLCVKLAIGERVRW